MKSFLTLFVLAFSIGLSPSSFALIIDVNPTFDGRVRDINGEQFGPLLDTTNFIEMFQGNIETRSVAEFATTGLLGSTINAASFSLPAMDRTNAGTVELFAFAGNGTLELADVFAGDFVGSFAPSIVNDNVASLDVGVLQALLDSAATHIGIMLLTPDSANAVIRGSDISRLQLDIVAAQVPTPGALVLVGSSLLGLAALRRRRSGLAHRTARRRTRLG